MKVIVRLQLDSVCVCAASPCLQPLTSIQHQLASEGRLTVGQAAAPAGLWMLKQGLGAAVKLVDSISDTEKKKQDKKGTDRS